MHAICAAHPLLCDWVVNCEFVIHACVIDILYANADQGCALSYMGNEYNYSQGALSFQFVFYLVRLRH